MAVNLGSTNTTRYYRVSSHAALILPDSDWAYLSVTRADAAGTSFLLDDNQLTLVRNSAGNLGATFTGTTYAERLDVMAVGTWYIVQVSRESGNMYIRLCEIGAAKIGSSFTVGAISGASTGANMFHFSRADADASRVFKGAVSWVALLKGKSLSVAELQDIARSNVVLLDAPYSADVKNVWHYDSKDNTTVVDSVGGLSSVQFGTGFGADIADPILPFTPSGTKGVTLILSDRATSSPRASLTGLVVRWWDSPTAPGAPVTFTATATTNASGALIVDLTASSLSVGQTGYIDVYKENGTPDLDFHFSGRVAVGTI